jgi:hypothetical protein
MFMIPRMPLDWDEDINAFTESQGCFHDTIGLPGFRDIPRAFDSNSGRQGLHNLIQNIFTAAGDAHLSIQCTFYCPANPSVNSIRVPKGSVTKVTLLIRYPFAYIDVGEAENPVEHRPVPKKEKRFENENSHLAGCILFNPFVIRLVPGEGG